MGKQKVSRIWGRLIIDSKAQKAFLLYSLTIVIVVLSLVIVVAWSPLNPLRSHGIEPTSFHFLSMMGFSLVSLVCCVLLGFYLSNIIFGPIKRLKNHMDAVARGETLADVHFRKNDYFSEVADSYNAIMKILRESQAQPASDKKAEGEG